MENSLFIVQTYRAKIPCRQTGKGKFLNSLFNNHLIEFHLQIAKLYLSPLKITSLLSLQPKNASFSSGQFTLCTSLPSTYSHLFSCGYLAFSSLREESHHSNWKEGFSMPKISISWNLTHPSKTQVPKKLCIHDHINPSVGASELCIIPRR